eukprot:gene8630-6061_t
MAAFLFRPLQAGTYWNAKTSNTPALCYPTHHTTLIDATST